jgi:hypothetical protein
MTMMQFDHDEFLPPFVKFSTSPCCTYFSSQYDGSHSDNNAQHSSGYSTERTTATSSAQQKSAHTSVYR